MKSLSDELGMLEAERDRFKNENESLKTRLAMQAGTIEEYRGQTRFFLGRIEKLTKYNTTIKQHIHNMLSTGDTIVQLKRDIDKAEKASEEPTAEPAPDMPAFLASASPAQVETIKSRVKRLIAGEEKVANGAPNGQA